jgi:hypothetical protein
MAHALRSALPASADVRRIPALLQGGSSCRASATAAARLTSAAFLLHSAGGGLLADLLLQLQEGAAAREQGGVGEGEGEGEGEGDEPGSSGGSAAPAKRPRRQPAADSSSAPGGSAPTCSLSALGEGLLAAVFALPAQAPPELLGVARSCLTLALALPTPFAALCKLLGLAPGSAASAPALLRAASAFHLHAAPLTAHLLTAAVFLAPREASGSEPYPVLAALTAAMTPHCSQQQRQWAWGLLCALLTEMSRRWLSPTAMGRCFSAVQAAVPAPGAPPPPLPPPQPPSPPAPGGVTDAQFVEGLLGLLPLALQWVTPSAASYLPSSPLATFTLLQALAAFQPSLLAAAAPGSAVARVLAGALALVQQQCYGGSSASRSGASAYAGASAATDAAAPPSHFWGDHRHRAEEGLALQQAALALLPFILPSTAPFAIVPHSLGAAGAAASTSPTLASAMALVHALLQQLTPDTAPELYRCSGSGGRLQRRAGPATCTLASTRRCNHRGVELLLTALVSTGSPLLFQALAAPRRGLPGGVLGVERYTPAYAQVAGALEALVEIGRAHV